MSEETRSSALFVRIRPGLRDRVKADAEDRGQSLSVWVERAFELRLAQSELPLDNRGGG
jgi:predicted HicB family RNase H-like nuclease